MMHVACMYVCMYECMNVCMTCMLTQNAIRDARVIEWAMQEMDRLALNDDVGESGDSVIVCSYTDSKCV